MLRSKKITYVPTNRVPRVVLAEFAVIVDREKLQNAKVVLWPGRRREDIRRRPVDELRARSSVAAETKVIKEPLELWDFVYGLVGSVPGGIDVLEDLGTLGCGEVAGLRTGRETLVLLIAFVVEGLGMDMAVPFID